MRKPRTARNRPPISRSGIWLTLAAAALVLLAVRPLVDWWALAQLQARGVAVPARNISTTIDASGRYAVDVVRYDFQLLDGTPGSGGVERFSHGPTPDLEPLELPSKCYEGALNVRYLPEAPRVHRLDLGLERRTSRSRRSVMLLLAPAAVVGTVGAALLLRRRTGRRT